MFVELRKAIFLFLFLVLFIPLESDAAGVSFSLSQPKVRVSVPAGGSQSGIIYVNSQFDKPMQIKMYLEDWKYVNIQDGTKEFFPPKTTPLSCADWISFSPQEVTIAPFGTQSINYVVRAPADAEGGHYAVMFFEAVFLKAEEAGVKTETVAVATSINIRLGALFYVEVKDKVKRAAELSNLSLLVDPKDKHLSVNVDLKNSGNTDITSSGTFHLMDKEGIVYARAEFKDTYTLPGDTAKLSAAWKEPIPKGKYDLVITLGLDKALQELGMGAGPAMIKEAEVEIGANGEVLKIGELK